MDSSNGSNAGEAPDWRNSYRSDANEVWATPAGTPGPSRPISAVIQARDATTDSPRGDDDGVLHQLPPLPGSAAAQTVLSTTETLNRAPADTRSSIDVDNIFRGAFLEASVVGDVAGSVGADNALSISPPQIVLTDATGEVPNDLQSLPPSTKYSPNPFSVPLPPSTSDLRPTSQVLTRDSKAFSAFSNGSFTSTQPPVEQLPYTPPHDSAGALNPDGEKAITTPTTPSTPDQKRPWTRRRKIFLIADMVAVAALLIAIIAVPVLVTQHRRSSSAGSSSSSSGSGSGSGSNGDGDTHGGGGNTNGASSLTMGGDGSTVSTETGETFTYSNKFGGFWVHDDNDPFNNNAQAQSWSPPLNESWDYQNNVIRGVNLGGWFVPEPFICPALFEPYTSTPGSNVTDEWTLSQAMAADAANGGLGQLEKHYQTFITEEDFAQIAGAGLNWIRLPIPFWAVQKYDEEPFLEGVSWKYILKAFQWARKYGLRIKLDLHAVPGSQNGYNHSGKKGLINFLYGTMGVANAQRTLDYIRVIAEFISQPEWVSVVPMFGIMNEPTVAVEGFPQLTSFYLQAHDIIRNVTGTGTGKGPFIVVSDGFAGPDKWTTLLPGKDRVALDLHRYLIFVSQIDQDPLSAQVLRPCGWATAMNTSWSTFGVTVAGEWSAAINDCGLWINGVGSGNRWDGTINGGTNVRGTGPNSCADWNNWKAWPADRKSDMQQFILANMDALQNWFFWTWKIGASSVSGEIESPMWSYQLGLQNGWIPPDPRAAIGVCGGKSPASALQPSMTGGPGAGTIAAEARATLPWPPINLNPGNLVGASLPTYTPTGPIPTLALPTPTVKGEGDGWFNAADTRPLYTPVAGCVYPDPWKGVNVAIPPACTGPAARRLVRNVIPRPRMTPPP